MDTDERRWVLILIPPGDLTDEQAEEIAAQIRTLATAPAAEAESEPDDAEDTHPGAREES
jgi:hypothetical protein